MRCWWWLLLVAVVLALTAYSLRPRPAPLPPPPNGPSMAWAFEAPEPGAVVAAPLLTGDRVYFATVHFRGLQRAGAVYALDRRTGQEIWRFDADGAMKPTASAPCLAGGLLCFGEGMHADFVCRFYALRPTDGHAAWHFETQGHIESSPCTAGGMVYFGSGDDGVYARDAASGAPRWHFREDLHIDASPTVADGRLFIGSGVSRRFRTTQVLGLDAATGAVLWRTSTDLPAWGKPTVADGKVYLGLGNGRLLEGAHLPQRPAGALVCLSAADGRRLWRVPAADAIWTRPVLGDGRVYFGCRDGSCSAVSAANGQRIWRVEFGSPVQATPALAEGRLYVAAESGTVTCLDAATGQALWAFDLGKFGKKPRLLAALQLDESDGRRRVLVAAEMRSGDFSTAALYCLRE